MNDCRSISHQRGIILGLIEMRLTFYNNDIILKGNTSTLQSLRVNFSCPAAVPLQMSGRKYNLRGRASLRDQKSLRKKETDTLMVDNKVINTKWLLGYCAWIKKPYLDTRLKENQLKNSAISVVWGQRWLSFMVNTKQQYLLWSVLNQLELKKNNYTSLSVASFSYYAAAGANHNGNDPWVI